MQNDKEEFNLLDVFVFIRRYVLVSLICGLLFGAVGYFVSEPPQKMYKSTMNVQLKKLKSKGVWLTSYMLHAAFFKKIKALGYHDVDFSNISSMKAKNLTLSLSLKRRDKNGLRKSIGILLEGLKEHCVFTIESPIEVEYMTGRSVYFQAVVTAIFGAVFGYLASFLFISFRRWQRDGLAL